MPPSRTGEAREALVAALAAWRGKTAPRCGKSMI